MAFNRDLKALYDKVVPPAAKMFDMAKDMEAEVDRLSEIVANFDKNLSIKANRQDLLGVDNKFRNFVKKEKYKPFVERTELEGYELKAEISDV